MKNLILVPFICLMFCCSSDNSQADVIACAQDAGVTIADKNPYIEATALGVAMMPEDKYWHAKIVGDTLIVRRQSTANGGSASYTSYKFLCRSGACPMPLKVKSYTNWWNDNVIINIDNPNLNSPNSGTIVDFDTMIGKLLLQEYIPGVRFVGRVQTQTTTIYGTAVTDDKKMWIDLTNLEFF